MGLNELGADEVHKYVGQEPSGRMFNELTLDFNGNLFGGKRIELNKYYNLKNYFVLSNLSIK